MARLIGMLSQENPEPVGQGVKQQKFRALSPVDSLASEPEGNEHDGRWHDSHARRVGPPEAQTICQQTPDEHREAINHLLMLGFSGRYERAAPLGKVLGCEGQTVV